MTVIAPPLTPRHNASEWVSHTLTPTAKRFALALFLTRMPRPDDDVAGLVSVGYFVLKGILRTQAGDAPFARSGVARLSDDAQTYAACDFVGATGFTLEASLSSKQALSVLHALDAKGNGLFLETSIAGVPASMTPRVPLAKLLSSPAVQSQRAACVRWVVPHADGTVTELPRVHAHLPDRGVGTRSAGAPIDVVPRGTRAVSLAYAMYPGSANRPSAAALAATNATAQPVRLDSHVQFMLANDVHMTLVDQPNAQTPTQHLPMMDRPDAPSWPDAIDATTLWYAPTFTQITPLANDDPATAAFSFVYSKTGVTIGSGGTATGLNAKLRITVQQVALAGAKAVPLNNLSIALEIPYRQTGQAAILTQRLPGTVTQNGDQLSVDIDLLDDWVRLAYAALAYPPGDGMPAPRLVVDYAFTVYQRVPLDGLPIYHPIAFGKIQAIDIVANRASMTPAVERPTIVASDLAVVGPTSYMQYRREAPLGSRAVPSLHINNAAMFVHPTTILPVGLPPLNYLVTRSMVRENTVDLTYPCSNLGSLYLEKRGDGTLHAVGCQDALKLGETGQKAFEEITELQQQRYRVYRSLQQPGRFLVVPSAYRVGRYSENSGDKAFHPAVMLYGQLDADPTKDRYCMSATLIADVSAYELALLRTALAAYSPANSTPAIVTPVDPFVGAMISYSWGVPSSFDQPQTACVVDGFIVTLSMGMADAQLMTTMIANSGIQGSATFALPDGTTFYSNLAIDGIIVGPADTGPLTASFGNGAVTFTNRTQQSLNVFDALVVDARGKNTSVAINATLAAGAATKIDAPAGGVSALADARLASAVRLDEVDIFVEDVTVGVTFINQVNFSNHQLTGLRVRSRIKSTSQEIATDLAENAVGTATFTLPITNYLAQQTLQYALEEATAKETTTTAWRDWDLSKGSIIGITADLL